MSDETLQVTGLTPDPSANIPEAAPPAEVVGEAPQPGDSATPDASEQATSQATDASTEHGEVVGEVPPAPKPARGVQKALDRLTARAVAAETERDQARALAAQTLMIQQQVAQQQRQAPPQQMQPQPPQLDQFKTWDEFNEAKAAYVAEQRSRAVTENILGQFVNGIVQRSQAETQQAHTINLQSKLNKAYTDGPSRFADWDEVVTASDLPVPPMMKEAIGRVHDPAAVVHFLGQNPQIHMRLAQADPTELMRGLGMIEANIYRPKTVSSKAPAPAKAVGARAGTPSAGAYRDDFTPAQHKAWLARQK